MIYRFSLVLITLFWVTMNVLLWRTEYGNRQTPGTQVRPEIIWHKILTAPDTSSLSIYQRGKKIGFCHWITSVGEDLSKAKEEDGPPEGMVGQVTGYRVQLEGNLALGDLPGRARFEGSLALDAHRQWQEISFQLTQRPWTWALRSTAAERKVVLKAQEGEAHFQRVLTFAELENPEALMRELLGPFAYGMLSTLGLGQALPESGPVRLGLRWEGRHDILKIGHSLVRTYRLQTRLLDRYQVVLIVSRVGEILRIELPNGLVVINDQLGML
jgi:hypothetical protein